MGKTLVVGVAALLSVTLGLNAATETSLLDAVKCGDAAAVRSLLRARTDANVADADGTTALHWAVQRDDLAAVEALLGGGADAKAANRYGVTALSLAATNGNAPMIERLLAAGADRQHRAPGRRDRADDGRADRQRRGGADAPGRRRGRARPRAAKGQTALMWAAAENNAAVMKLLVEAGADVRERSRGGVLSPLLFAVRAGHVDAARALLDAGAPVDDALPDGTSALVLAVINAHYEMAGALLERGADANGSAQGWTALHQIAWSRRHNVGFNLPGPVQTGALDSLDLVRKLVARGANVNARLTKEPKDGNRNMLNRIGATPFLMAAKSDDVPLMRVLLESRRRCVDHDHAGTTALMAAAGVGIWAPGENPGTHDEALAAVKLALEAGGGKVNDIDQEGETALHGAVYRGGAIPRDPVPPRSRRRARRRQQARMDAADRCRRRRVHAGRAQALSRGRRSAAPRRRAAGLPRAAAPARAQARGRRRLPKTDLGRRVHRRAGRARAGALPHRLRRVPRRRPAGRVGAGARGPGVPRPVERIRRCSTWCR